MAKYRKKPVVIEAVQWTGGLDSEHAIRQLDCNGDKLQFVGMPSHAISISTLEGVMEAQFEDWIIKGVKGELYPCKPDIFEETYEKVEE